MSLKKYRSKRDFSITAEPRGGSPTSGGRRQFVVQKHSASRLHYDFRLEIDGVLKSWAVPKGPSLDPIEKRLAVEVEDHPLDYATFEGTIPEGEYGAGQVIVWDAGTWRPFKPAGPRELAKRLRDGRLELEISGQKLHGRWILVRAGGKNWLLIKRSDVHARSARDTPIVDSRPESVISGRTIEDIQIGRRPRRRSRLKRAKASVRVRRPAPQLATLVDRPPSGEDWIHEIKFDGYRAICEIQEDAVSVRTRNGLDWTARFPWLADQCRGLAAATAILDGEIVCLKEDGRNSFAGVQHALKSGRDGGLAYFVFDLLELDGESLSTSPLFERKARLKKLLARSPVDRIRYSEHWRSDGMSVLRASCGLDMEGIVSKRAAEPYSPGRSADWLKTKCKRAQEFVIGGYTKPTGARTGFRSLLLGVFNDGEFIYSGKVGSGFSQSSIEELYRRMKSLRTKDCPFSRNLSAIEGKVVWLKPELVANIGFAEWTPSGALRHPTFQGLREDKSATDVGVERPAGLTHPSKILFSRAGKSKKDLADYYSGIAPWILPHLKNRPLSLLRCPEGAGGECFFQKHAGPSAIKSVSVFSKEKLVKEEIIYVETIADIVALVQLGALELHAWGCHRNLIDRPDMLVFDLDPGPQVEWKTVRDAALELREFLERLRLKSFLKTTGGKGLHLHVPIRADYTWSQAKSFSKAVAVKLATDRPELFTATISKAKRSGKIFINYLRNGFGATAVAPYSARARPCAEVAMPIAWSGLTKIKSPREFTIGSVHGLLSRRRKDPWGEFFDLDQELVVFSP